MYLMITLFILFTHENAIARSLIQTGNAAKSSFTSLGEIVAVLGFIIVGILFATGSERASSKAVMASFGTIFIFAATAIVAFFRGFAG